MDGSRKSRSAIEEQAVFRQQLDADYVVPIWTEPLMRGYIICGLLMMGILALAANCLR